MCLCGIFPHQKPRALGSDKISFCLFITADKELNILLLNNGLIEHCIW